MNPSACLWAVLVLLCDPFQSAWASPEPPNITPLRYDEDYSYLGDATSEEDAWWTPLKYVSLPLGLVRPQYLSFGAELWTRIESFENLDWGDAPSNTYLWARLLPYASVHVGGLTAFAQLIAAGSLGVEDVSPVDENSLDLLQGFVEVDAFPESPKDLTLRFGRQLLSLGSGRLVDVRYGVNVLEPFEGVRLMLDVGRLQFDALYVRPIESRSGSFDDRVASEQALFGGYATVFLDRESELGADLYYLGFENEAATFAVGTGREERHTFGLRAFGSWGPWSLNYELFLQLGTFRSQQGGQSTIFAWSVATDTTYAWPELPGGPRLKLRANVASGDEVAEDGQLGTFNPLFPKGKYFGELTPIGPSNIWNLHPSLQFTLVEGLSASAAVVLYWRFSVEDALYGLNGLILRPGAPGDGRFIGVQWDIALEHQVNRSFDTVASYSQFHAGPFIRRTGPEDTIRFVALEARFRF